MENSKLYSIDDEWEMFLSGNSRLEKTNFLEEKKHKKNVKSKKNKESSPILQTHCGNLDSELICGDNNNENENDSEIDIIDMGMDKENESSENIPKCTSIYISTKTNIAYLDHPIDIKNVFWETPIIPYSYAGEGVIKKQIKINTFSQEELSEIQNRLKKEIYVEEHIITHIDNTNAENSYNDHSKRIIFKDIRKISIGLSKKDIMSYRNKKKSAFYNCFVLILRLKIDDLFKEFHVKVFNTGKLEIPGIQSEIQFQRILHHILIILRPLVQDPLDYKEGTTETVLINSNFNCGYYINRELFYDILKYKYNIQAIYDPCSYPGIQCKFYFNPDVSNQTGSQISEEKKGLYQNVSEVSFMVFRTGSVLIVGKCDEAILHHIYDFLKNIFQEEYKEIGKSMNMSYPNKWEDAKKKKIRKKIMYTTLPISCSSLE
jgi:hypothetical protein